MDEKKPSRIMAFDHVRGIAVICMIISHVIVEFGSHASEKTIMGHIMDGFFGTAPAAPVFMLLMGIFFSYPREKPTLTKIGRGAKIFLLGILLNIARGVIPITIAAIFFKDVLQNVMDVLHMTRGQIYWRFFYNLDILEFAGLAFMILAILQMVIKRSAGWIITATVVLFVAPYLWGIGESWGMFYSFVQPLWGNALSSSIPSDTLFPVFPWLVYPIAGLLIGKGLSAGIDTHSMYKRMLTYGALLFSAGAGFVLINPAKELGDYYRMYPAGTAMTLGFALLWTCLFMWFSQRGIFQGPLGKLVFWSENITIIYCVQWVLFGFSILIFGFKDIDDPWFLVGLSPVYIFLSYLVSRWIIGCGGFMRAFKWFAE